MIIHILIGGGNEKMTNPVTNIITSTARDLPRGGAGKLC